jgi:phosphatidylglycerophosphate synthase
MLWAVAGILVMLALGPLLMPVLPAGAWILAAATYTVATVTAGDLLRRTYPHGILGLCNIVTLVRLVIVAALVAPLAVGGGQSWVVFALASLALALDGVDGWLARRGGLVSGFGARFDVEVDSLFALVLALLALGSGKVGAFVLLLGLMRYVFVLAAALFPWLGQPLPERFSRKAVCVLQLSTLIVIQLPVVSGGVATALAVFASGVLIWSFALDIRYLWRARA